MSIHTGEHGRERSSGSGRRAGAERRTSLCSFALGERSYGIDTRFVGEVVSVARLTPVPLAPGPVLGVFSLRGTPMPLVDIGVAVGLTDTLRAIAGVTPAIILRGPGLTVAASIDAMGRVLTPAAGDVLRPSDQTDPLIEAFIDSGEGGVVAVLDTEEVFARLERIKLRRA